MENRICNKNMRPILTIAIPTYNRVDKLKKTLPIVLNQAYDLNTEIFVSDNASTDKTEDYIKEIKKKYPRLIYYRNETNLGLDGNFLNCFNKAKGKYLIMLGDDDILLPGAIKEIFAAIKENPIFIHLNNYWIGEKSTSRFLETKMISYEDKNDFLDMIGIYITFTSTLIYNVDLIRKVNNKENFYGYNMLLSHVALETIKYPGKCILITRNCLNTATSPLSYDLYKTWIYGFYDLIWNTGRRCRYDIERLKKFLYFKFKWEILDMVIYWKSRDVNIEKWDQDYLWPIIKKFPYLEIMYKTVIDSNKKSDIELWKEIQDIRLYDLLDFCHQHSHNYLYGMGYNGEIIYNYLLKNNIKIDGIIISDDKTKKTFHDITVYWLSEIPNDKKNIGIVLTPNFIIQQEIINNLKNKTFSYDLYQHKFYIMLI